MSGFLILYGYLYGYGWESISGKIRRGHRIFCNNRKKRTGCGRTFSVLLAAFIKCFSIPAATMAHFLDNIAAGMSKLGAFISAQAQMSVASAYRLYKRFSHSQSFIREKLFSASDPPPDPCEPDPVKQTIRHLSSLKNLVCCAISAFQLKFQRPFFEKPPRK